MIIGKYDPLREQMFQIIDKDGNLVGEDPQLDIQLLKDMYWWMLYTRMCDDKALKLQRQGRIGTFAPNTGQEAAQIGSALALNKEDWMFPAFRELGSYMIRGLSFETNLLYFAGDVRGNKVPEGINNLPMFIPVSTQIPVATGAAWGMKLKNAGTATIVYFGDGATSEGDFHEGMNFAGVMKAPIVFVCQNNQWAISVPRKKQTASKTLAQKAIAYGFLGIQVDGNDVLAMYLATKEALEKARSGGGPTMIEAVTYRLRMHTTADDPTKYRTDEELKQWEDKDPLKRFKIYLEKKGIWTEQWQQELEAKAKTQISESVKNFESIEPLTPESMFEYMFQDMHEELSEELEYLKKSIAEKEIEDDTEEIAGGFP